MVLTLSGASRFSMVKSLSFLGSDIGVRGGVRSLDVVSGEVQSRGKEVKEVGGERSEEGIIKEDVA